MTDVVDTMSKACRVMTLTVYIGGLQLRVVSVRMKVYIVLVIHFVKTRWVD